MKNIWLLIVAIAWVAMPARIWAQDVSGEWNGEMITQRGFVKAVFEFSVDGAKVIGSAIAGEEERPLFDGKIKGNKISFVLRRYQGEKFTPYTYEGKILGNIIQFTLTWGANQRTQFTAARAKRR